MGEFDPQNLRGMTREDAEQAIAAHGMVSRITRIDEHYPPVTRDYHTNRINLDIFYGRVTRVTIG